MTVRAVGDETAPAALTLPGVRVPRRRGHAAHDCPRRDPGFYAGAGRGPCTDTTSGRIHTPEGPVDDAGFPHEPDDPMSRVFL